MQTTVNAGYRSPDSEVSSPPSDISRKTSGTNEPEECLSMNFEDYEVGHAIGFGSSAIVYYATYKPTIKSVAVKMIDLDRFERNQIDELRKEIQVMTLCKHPNLLSIHASFVNESKLWIVAPFMSAGSCLDIMRTAFPEGFEETVIATILIQALQGLDYLHKHGHIHRDVKAGNLLVDKDGTVKLADFGVSSSLMEDGERKGIRKTFVGTPCWMAPEVMEMSKGYNSKADIWSFGITALELANGNAPFAKFPPMKVIHLTLTNNPPTLDRHRTKYKYSKVFKEMIDLCLHRDPNKRPSADILLKHSFFKQAKKKSLLTSTILMNLPPIQSRIKPESQSKEESAYTSQSWDFSDSSNDFDAEWIDESVKDDKSLANMSENEATVRKGRFVVESVDENTKGSCTPLSGMTQMGLDPQTSAAVANALNCAEIKKGRFCVIESSTSSAMQSRDFDSAKLSRQPSLNDGEIVEDKKSRFELIPLSDNEGKITEDETRISRFTVKTQSTDFPHHNRKSRFKVLSVDARRTEPEILEELSPSFDTPKLNEVDDEKMYALMRNNAESVKKEQHKRGRSGGNREVEIPSLLSALDSQFKMLMTENASLKSQLEALKKENELLRILKLESPKDQ